MSVVLACDNIKKSAYSTSKSIDRLLYITDKEEMYSGCYGNVAVSLYPYEFTGKYGVGVGLNAIQKTKDGERLDGGTSLDDFDTVDIDENDDLFK